MADDVDGASGLGDDDLMAKRSPKPRDMNQRAAAVVSQATGEDDGDVEVKDPVAVQHGREGGLARANAMTAKQRSEAASKAARARWATEATG